MADDHKENELERFANKEIHEQRAQVGGGHGDIGGYKEDPASASHFLHATSSWAEMAVQAKNKEHVHSKRKGWEKWIEKELKGGGGGLRAWVKRAFEGTEVTANWEGGQSATPTAIAETDFIAWKSIWESLQQHARTPWRDQQKGTGDEGTATLPPISARQLRKGKPFLLSQDWMGQRQSRSQSVRVVVG